MATPQEITMALRAQGHYDDPELFEDPDTVQWIRWDAERVLQGPLTYEGIDEALIDSGLHDPTNCNDVCVRAVLEVVGGRE